MIKEPIKNIGISRLGNKQTDLKFFKKYIPLDAYTIVEPFAGTFAVVRNFFYDEKYNIILNDLDNEYYNILKEIKENCTEFKNKLIKYSNDINNIVNYKERNEYIKNIKESNTLKKMFSARGISKGLSVNTLQNLNILSIILNRCQLYNENFIKICLKYKDDETAFIFLDPPYLESHNVSYSMEQKEKGKIKDNTEMFIIILKMLKTFKSKILLIINKNALTSYIYKKYIKGEYEKVYQISKRQTTHLIICNYTI